MNSDKPLFQVLASAIEARENCVKHGNREWLNRWNAAIEDIMSTSPNGSGIDCGTRLQLSACNSSKLVFACDFHHMNEYGSYDGWTQHTITVRPNLASGIEISVSGRNRNDIKDYLAGTYLAWLQAPIASLALPADRKMLPA